MSEVISAVNLYDSDVLRIEKVLEQLNRKVGTATNLDGFQNEIKDRFAKIGLGVSVKWYSTNVSGTFMPEVQIETRLEGSFDPDQMVAEVTKDVLELGGGGVIKTTKDHLEPKKHSH